MPCNLHRATGNSLPTESAALRNREEFQIVDVERRSICGRAPLGCLQISHRHKTRLDVGLGQMLEAKIRKFG